MSDFKLPEGADLERIMKQAQDMQEKMKKTQGKLANTTVESEAGAGLVQIRMTCRHQVQEIKISEELLDEDPKTIGDTIAAAFNSANQKIEEVSKKALENLTADIDLKLPADKDKAK